MRTRHLLVNLIEAGPLLFFLVCYRLVEPSSPQDWLVPYLGSAVLAVFTMTLLQMKGISLNPVFIGIDAYLICGGLGLVTRQSWLNQLYAYLQSSGMLAWIVVVGAVYLLFSPKGFIGIDSKNRQIVAEYSVYLLIIAIFTFSLAYLFQSKQLISEFVPFVILFAGQGALKSRAKKRLGMTED